MKPVWNLVVESDVQCQITVTSTYRGTAEHVRSVLSATVRIGAVYAFKNLRIAGKEGIIARVIIGSVATSSIYFFTQSSL